MNVYIQWFSPIHAVFVCVCLHMCAVIQNDSWMLCELSRVDFKDPNLVDLLHTGRELYRSVHLHMCAHTYENVFAVCVCAKKWKNEFVIYKILFHVYYIHIKAHTSHVTYYMNHPTYDFCLRMAWMSQMYLAIFWWKYESLEHTVLWRVTTLF